jgi:hypothetical protein
VVVSDVLSTALSVPLALLLYQRVTMVALAAGKFPIMLWLLIKGADARPPLPRPAVAVRESI